MSGAENRRRRAASHLQVLTGVVDLDIVRFVSAEAGVGVGTERCLVPAQRFRRGREDEGGKRGERASERGGGEGARGERGGGEDGSIPLHKLRAEELR